MNELLHEFFNRKSDANKYLTAEQQEDLEKDFAEWVVNQKEGASGFEENVRPLMKYLAENHHPMTTCIITQDKAEVLEGAECFTTDEYIVD